MSSGPAVQPSVVVVTVTRAHAVMMVMMPMAHAVTMHSTAVHDRRDGIGGADA